MTPAHDPKFWPATMRRDGCWADDRALAVAWSGLWGTMQKGQGENYTSLIPYLRQAGAKVDVLDMSYPYHRLAYAMMQRARKAGIVFYAKGRWWPEARK